jgi:hypothetical protein
MGCVVVCGVATSPCLAGDPLLARASLTQASIAAAASAIAQDGSAGSDAATSDGKQSDAAPQTTDKSGTDPTKFLRQVRLNYEYASTANDASVNTLSFSYVQPFAEQTMNLRFKLPLLHSDVSGSSETGIGDFSVRYNWLADITQSYGLLVGAELLADTATDDSLGRGKWVISPLATYAIFLNSNMIFAPTYQHNLSFAGDDARNDVNESVFDFYFVYTADDKESWVTVDPALVIDWENNEAIPFSIEVQYGRKLGTLWGGAVNGFIQPGIGIGQDRAIDWNIEVGISIIGF